MFPLLNSFEMQRFWNVWRKPLFVRAFLLLAFMVVIIIVAAPLLAQEEYQWSTQRRIPGYAADSRTPILFADQNQTVHAFASTWIEDDKVIVYSQWTKNTGWTSPLDIILPQFKRHARVKDAFLDQNGLVHLVFFSGDEEQAGIFYSNAPLSDAGRAPAWSTPKLIGENAEAFPEVASLVGDSEGRIFVLFSATRPSPGLYATHTLDGGDNWSEPIPMFLTYRNGHKPNALKMVVDDENNLFAVWDEVDDAGNSRGVYFARFNAGDADWSEPVQLSAETVSTPDAPTIIKYNDELFVIFHNMDGSQTRYMVRSSDGGKSWSEKTRLFPHVGSNGEASLVVDNNNVLHMLFGNRVTLNNGATIYGMWHSTWEGEGWSTPQAIVSGPRVADLERGNGFDPSFANALVSQGNLILVTWVSDPAAGQNGVWYSHTTVDAPELAVKTGPILEQTTAAVTSDMEQSSITADPTTPVLRVVSPQAEPVSTDASPMAPLVIGLVPVLLLVLAIPIVQLLRHKLRT